MGAKIIDGVRFAAEVRRGAAERALALAEKWRAPCLAVVIVGDNPASRIYVRNKKRACAECGINSLEYALPESTSENELLELLAGLGGNRDIDGLLCQLPLPGHISEKKVTAAVPPDKDVDGFHPINAGRLLTGAEGFLPCTPAGIVEMLKRADIEIAGKRCAVVGRSSIVGKPAALLMLRENATVTVCHSRTRGLGELLLESDIVIAAAGRAGLITADMIKPGAAVIDVGMNRLPNGKLCGDVDFEAVREKAGAISPVPGGVGPMTVAMLMENTVKACEIHCGREA